MILSITSLKVKRIHHLLRIIPYSFKAVMQLQKSKCVAFKTKGLANPSYTMTLWKSEEDMLEYFRSGAHAVAMREASKWAEEIRSVRLERETLIGWKEAKALIERDGKGISKKKN
jgi:hypothetical protein